MQTIRIRQQVNSAFRQLQNCVKNIGDTDLSRLWKQRDDAQKMKLLEGASEIFEYDRYLQESEESDENGNNDNGG